MMMVAYTVHVEVDHEASHTAVPDIGQHIAILLEDSLMRRADVVAVESVDATYVVAPRRVQVAR